jgi:hypothetical protein
MVEAAKEMERKSVRAPPGTIPPGGPLPEGQTSSRPAAAASGAAPADERAYAAPRPASIFSATAPAGGIFGEVGGIDEKSLDDAILSYLAEDPDKTGSDDSGS